jgi:hypothetical protein
MKLSRLSSLTAIALTAGLLSQAHAVSVPGKKNNCSAVWDTGLATATISTTAKPSSLTCIDGDPSCDADGLPNGTCVIGLNACVGQASDGCTPGTLSTLTFNAPITRKGLLAGFVAPSPTTPGCGTAGSISLALKRIPKNTSKPLRKQKPSKPVVLLMKSKGFVNKLRVQCVPAGPTAVASVCPDRTDIPGAPKQITLTVPLEDRAHPEQGNGSDLDNGWTGTSHNFPVIGGSSLKYCLSGCDGTSTFACTGTGTTSAGGAPSSLNGADFGAPLPLLAANVPVCVVNQYQDATLSGTFNLQTGEAGSAASPNLVHLNSMVFLRATFPEVCPRCNVPGGGGGIGSTGTCSNTSTKSGAACRVNGEVTVAGKGLYLLSSDCPPINDSGPPTALDIKLPFTTGTATPLVGPNACPDSAGPQTSEDSCSGGSCTATCTGAACAGTDAQGNCIDAKGGISQLCCSSKTDTPCFPTKGGGSIVRTGKPGTDGQTLVNAALFCIAHTNSTLINVTTGLPGPGALLLPATVTVSK